MKNLERKNIYVAKIQMKNDNNTKLQRKKNYDVVIVKTNLTPENIKQFEARLVNELFNLSIAQEDNNPISES